MGTAVGLLLFLPVVIVAAAGLVLGTGSVWFAGVGLVCGLWVIALVRLWRLRLRGELRSLARGTVHVDGLARRRGRRRQRSGGRR